MAATAIALPPLALETVEVQLIGTSPLIVHAWSEKALRAMADKQQKKATKGREAKVPFDDFVGSLYWLSERPEKPTEDDVEASTFGFPAVAFKDFGSHRLHVHGRHYEGGSAPGIPRYRRDGSDPRAAAGDAGGCLSRRHGHS